MAHNLTVHEIKYPNRNPISREIPKEGTKTRKVYDLLMGHRGRWVTISSSSFGTTASSISRISERLINSYGLDIRKNYGGKWLLAGEWFGKVYIDYVVEK